jgi:hypothetical protein
VDGYQNYIDYVNEKKFRQEEKERKEEEKKRQEEEEQRQELEELQAVREGRVKPIKYEYLRDVLPRETSSLVAQDFPIEWRYRGVKNRLYKFRANTPTVLEN